MGISHIEDLPIADFINAIRNLNEFDITEKVDGFNLRFGIDDEGFYSTGKDDNRKYRASEYGSEFRYSGFKAAHMAFSRVLPFLLKANIFGFGDEIEVEVLYGEMPNTIVYSGNENKIIVLRRKKGEPNIDAIKAMLHEQTITLDIVVPKTKDGRTIEQEQQSQKWIFSENSKVEQIRIKRVQDDIELERLLSTLEAFMYDDSGIGQFSNAELISLPLNKKPPTMDIEDWRETKEEIKIKRSHVRSHVMNHKLDIKHKLLTDLVRNIGSQFGPDVESGGWIEGLVFHHRTENEDFVFKLVDKDMFTALNKFNWHVRKSLNDNPNGVNNIESLTGLIMGAMARKVGHPELGTKQKTRYINKNKITVQSLMNDIPDFHKMREEFIHIIDMGLDRTHKYHNIYTKYKHFANHDVDFGDFKQTFKIDKSLDEKNLEAFAELYQLLDLMRYKTHGAKNKKDLAMLLLDPKAETARSVSSLWV